MVPDWHAFACLLVTPAHPASPGMVKVMVRTYMFGHTQYTQAHAGLHSAQAHTHAHEHNGAHLHMQACLCVLAVAAQPDPPGMVTLLA